MQRGPGERTEEEGGRQRGKGERTARGGRGQQEERGEWGQGGGALKQHWLPFKDSRATVGSTGGVAPAGVTLRVTLQAVMLRAML